MPPESKNLLFCRHHFFIAVVCLFAICFTRARAADTAAEENWPQWRGPMGNGIAPKADPPINWSATSHLKWQASLPGEGTSTPIIWGDRVFIQVAINTGHAGATAASSAQAAPQGGRRGRGGFGGGPPPSEAYQFVVLCIDRKTGKTLWQQVAREEVPHEGRHQTEGSFASPSPVTD
ncbi:MAG TPA: hypothetical protein VH370_24010, partial [Humisphaera sp.]|nr:hypothetical protein [Humisphaera sp.]